MNETNKNVVVFDNKNVEFPVWNIEDIKNEDGTINYDMMKSEYANMVVHTPEYTKHIFLRYLEECVNVNNFIHYEVIWKEQDEKLEEELLILHVNLERELYYWFWTYRKKAVLDFIEQDEKFKNKTLETLSDNEKRYLVNMLTLKYIDFSLKNNKNDTSICSVALYLFMWIDWEKEIKEKIDNKEDYLNIIKEKLKNKLFIEILVDNE